MFIDEKKLPNYDVRESIKRKFKNTTSVLIITNSILAGAYEYAFSIPNANTYVEVIISWWYIKIFK